ncbi:MAG TPA: type II CRISPR RNA-guided endonuclease Cas9, partial [Planctomycetota bacterium]|nr:type II CRISPR RNA-guided endonuclease Cas9 [Planctomycetota bacterium]
MANPHRPWILGIDLGTNSLGWAALALEDDGSGHPEQAKVTGFLSNPHDPKAPPTVGSRIFEAGKEKLGQGQGKESTRNAARRQARQVRRSLMRRERRLRKTFNLLVHAGLLPDVGRHETDPSTHGGSLERDGVIKNLDAQLHAHYRSQVLESGGAADSLRMLENLPYFLRARGLDQPLTAHEFGRVLYHLAQRRGYKSNRKAANADEEEDGDKSPASGRSDAPSKKGKVAQGISQIDEAMKAANHRTLGEHLLHETPYRRRLRARWTARSMYESEFETLWSKQHGLGHLPIDDTIKKALQDAIFHQRPLKSQKHLIGFCTLEDGERMVQLSTGELVRTRRRRRMPQFFIEAQQFRLLQSIHDLRFKAPLEPTILPLSERERELLREELTAFLAGGKEPSAKDLVKSALRDKAPGTLSMDGKRGVKAITAEEIPNLKWICENFGAATPLSEEQKNVLFLHMEITSSCTWAELKAHLGLPKKGKFTAEEGGGNKFLGNHTSAQFYEVFQSRWLTATEEQRIKVVEECYSIDDDVALKQRIKDGKGPWRAIKAEPTDGDKVLRISTPPDYLAYSRTAVKRLLPLMRSGMDLTAAKAALYPESEGQESCELLPPVLSSLGDTRNPVVQRALTELRRVVNMLIKLYGKPSFIRVEMARDLKASVDERKRRQDQMRSNEKERDSARAAIAPLMPGREPSASDIEKYRLWQECGGVCPYTGRSIGMAALFGAGTDVDIEHIIPFSMSQDNSFLNKTLCYAEFNRTRKRNQTPWQTLHGSPDEWNLAVSRMKGNQARRMHPAKLERFLLDDDQLEDFLGDFTSRQLNDTRYASRLAIRYLAELYGGVLERGVDPAGRLRVQAGTGGVTATLRSVLGMSRALGGEIKTRDDHRHHAIDAVAVALAGPQLLPAMAPSCG